MEEEQPIILTQLRRKRFLLRSCVVLLLLAFWVAGGDGTTAEIMFGGLILLAMIATMLLIQVYCLLAALFDRKWLAGHPSIVILSIVMGGFLGWGKHRLQEFHQAQCREKLLKGIVQYSKAKGCAPTSLEELTPDFIPSIPSTSEGWHSVPFDYKSTSDSCSFVLSYEVTIVWGGDVIAFDSELGEWDTIYSTWL